MPDGPLSGGPEVAGAQQTCAAIPLSSDIATVEALIGQGPAEGWALGHPHAEEELDGVMARNGDVEQVGELRQWAVSEHADT